MRSSCGRSRMSTTGSGRFQTAVVSNPSGRITGRELFFRDNATNEIAVATFSTTGDSFELGVCHAPVPDAGHFPRWGFP